ncbi:MAG TPA: DegT/DnrJ/EryC1/StrS family aminotransferase [Candidatus Paceibacterota bacterium]|nr:DegT/DnrJ/EryC1/StrS family aminotransferase [Candidatus Paceibacterota bacterium]
MSYKVPFVNIPKQYQNMKEEILKTFDDVLSKGDLILRKDVEEFEKNIASFVGTKYAVGLNSGTDTMFFALKALGTKEGDEVITVSHTFVASIAVIVQTGATPVLIEVKKDFTMDMDKLEEAITSKTKAIIPVHLNGRTCQMDKLMDIAKKHNLIVIEDAAQALGAKFKGKMAGSFGSAGSFSLYPFKILGCFGDGGILTTDDENLAEKVRLLRDHGQKTKTEIVCFGWNSRLDNLQAAVLNLKFKYLPECIERRREIATIYDKGLRDVSGIELPPSPDFDKDYFDVFQNYVLKAQNRDKLFDFLKEKGVETLIKDPIANHHQVGLGLSGFKLPFTEKLAKEVISLPLYPELTKEQIEYVIECVRNFYE